MSRSWFLIGFRSIYPLSTRGPGDMIPYSSTMASTYETPILPRLETMLGAISKILIETRRIDKSPCDNIREPDRRWECIVSLVFKEYLGIQSVLGPVLVVSGQQGSNSDGGITSYYVNIGSGLLKLSEECIKKYIGASEKLWNSISEVDVKRKYNKMNEYEKILEELRGECIISPHTIFATGISLSNISRATRHGLIYSYVLRDFANLTSGGNYVVGIIAEVDREKRVSVDGIIALLGPRGRPGVLVEEDISNVIGTDLRQDIKDRISISLTPLKLVKGEDAVVIHPLKPKPLVVQLAKSTLVNGRWAKTGIEPAYRAGIVAVKGYIGHDEIGNSTDKLRVYYSIRFLVS